MAKAAPRDIPDLRGEQSYNFAALNRLFREQTEEAVESWWLQNSPRRYEELDLRMRQKRLPLLGLPRWAYHRRIAARTGHGDLKGYHDRLGHENFG